LFDDWLIICLQMKVFKIQNNESTFREWEILKRRVPGADFTEYDYPMLAKTLCMFYENQLQIEKRYVKN